MEDFEKDIQREVLLVLENPSTSITAIFNTITSFVKGVLEDDINPYIAENFEYPENPIAWAQFRMKQLRKWINNCDAKFVENLTFSRLLSRETNMEAFLDYRTIILRLSRILSPRKISKVLKRGLEKALEKNNELIQSKIASKI